MASNWDPKIGEEVVVLTKRKDKTTLVVSAVEQVKGVISIIWCQDHEFGPYDFGSDYGSDDFKPEAMEKREIKSYKFTQTPTGKWKSTLGIIVMD